MIWHINWKCLIHPHLHRADCDDALVYLVHDGHAIVTDSFPDGTRNYVYVDGAYQGHTYSADLTTFACATVKEYRDLFPWPVIPGVASDSDDDSTSPPSPKPQRRRRKWKGYTIADVPSGSDSDVAPQIIIMGEDKHSGPLTFE